MNKFTKVAFKFLDLIVIFVMTFGSPMSAMAQDTGPSLTTHQADYAPGDSALIIGTRFTAGDYVLKVSGPSDPRIGQLLLVKVEASYQLPSHLIPREST